MLGALDGIEEYNNSAALLGIDGPETQELLGVLGRMNPIQRMRVMNKMAGGVPSSKGSRGEMENILMSYHNTLKMVY